MRLRTKILLAVVGVVVVASGAIWWVYSRDLAAARLEASGGRVIATDAGLIEFGEVGTGVPLLSIHGAGGGYDQGLANVAQLVGDQFHVIAPSRFGYLGTRVPADPSVAAQADAHVALLDALEVERAVVVGISAGAHSALELAIRHPERVSALVLIVPATWTPDSAVAVESSRGSDFAFRLVNSGADFAWWALERVAPSVLIRFVGVPPEVLAAAGPAEQARVAGIIAAIEPLSRRMAGINLDSIRDTVPPPFDKVMAPTLVISARDDLFNTLPAAEYAAAHIPGAELKVFETGGHLLVGHTSDARAAVSNFLERSGAVLPRPRFAAVD